MKTQLIPTDSPLYLKRLARELNSQSDGFYHNGIRYSAARLKAGRLQVYRLAAYLDPQDPLAEFHKSWVEVDPSMGFSDAYGREVCATRVP